MKKCFSEQQIIGFLREAEAGMAIKELYRKHGFSETSYYLWRSKFGGMTVSDASPTESSIELFDHSTKDNPQHRPAGALGVGAQCSRRIVATASARATFAGSGSSTVMVRCLLCLQGMLQSSSVISLLKRKKQPFGGFFALFLATNRRGVFRGVKRHLML